MPALSGRLVLVGAGKMGGAMLDGWLAQGTPGEQVAIIDPFVCESLQSTAREHAITLNPDIADIKNAQVVLIAVKPQMMDEVLPSITPLASSNPVFISVAAGSTIGMFENAFGKDAAIVRAMPNTPAAVGRGITAIFPNQNCTPEHVAFAEELLGAIGEVISIDSEDLMDAVTAVSGSGPAYVFHLIECMAKAGEAEGLPAETAMQLARATVSGAGELVRQSGIAAETLRKNVTSPNGTTAAALEVLMAEDAMPLLLRKAIRAAAQRGKELAG